MTERITDMLTSLKLSGSACASCAERTGKLGKNTVVGIRRILYGKYAFTPLTREIFGQSGQPNHPEVTFQFRSRRR